MQEGDGGGWGEGRVEKLESEGETVRVGDGGAERDEWRRERGECDEWRVFLRHRLDGQLQLECAPMHCR